MPESIIFDQLGFVKRGVDVGVPREHAEWLATEQAGILKNNLVTKEDLLRLELKIEAARANLLKFLIIAMPTQIAVIVALLKLLD